MTLKNLTPIEIEFKEYIMKFIINNRICKKSIVTVLGYLISRLKVKKK